MGATSTAPTSTAPDNFNLHTFLLSGGVARKVVEFDHKATLFSQGSASSSVMYILRGGVTLSVVSKTGKEAVVAFLGPGDFIGESALAGQPFRTATATAIKATTVLDIDKKEVLRVLQTEPAFSVRFISYMLRRNIRIEDDLADQLFNYSEKRLARTLLQLAHYGGQDRLQTVIANISQETLAEMVGTTRSRVNFFMNKFRKLGFIEYDSEIRVNTSLQNVVLHD